MTAKWPERRCAWRKCGKVIPPDWRKGPAAHAKREFCRRSCANAAQQDKACDRVMMHVAMPPLLEVWIREECRMRGITLSDLVVEAISALQARENFSTFIRNRV